MDKIKHGMYVKDENVYDFNYFCSLSANQKMEFVRFVSNALVDGDNFNYITSDLIFDYAIISIFTDVDVSEVVIAEGSISAIEKLVNETDIVETVKNALGNDMIYELRRAVNYNIEHKTGIKLNSLERQLEDLLHLIENKFAAIDSSNIEKLVNTFGNIDGNITPEKILKAYTQSDMFKQQYEKNALTAEDRERKLRELLEAKNR